MSEVDNANCRNADPRLFFDQNAQTERQVIRVYCQPCTVKDWCLDRGKNEVYGIWGGLRMKERIGSAKLTENRRKIRTRKD